MQLCYLNATVTNQAINASYAGGLFIGSRSWIFPAVFNAAPVVVPNIKWDNSASWALVNSTSTTGAGLQVLDVVSRASGNPTFLNFLAIEVLLPHVVECLRLKSCSILMQTVY